MEKITVEELQSMGGLYFETILDATNQYPYEVKKCSEQEAGSWFNKLMQNYAIYADFYTGRITKEALLLFQKELSEEEYQLLVKICHRYKVEEGQDFVVFRPEEEEMALLVTISYRELLFSTFYITDPAVTIWSNFDGEFVVLAENLSIVKEIIR